MPMFLRSETSESIAGCCPEAEDWEGEEVFAIVITKRMERCEKYNYSTE